MHAANDGHRLPVKLDHFTDMFHTYLVASSLQLHDEAAAGFRSNRTHVRHLPVHVSCDLSRSATAVTSQWPVPTYDRL